MKKFSHTPVNVITYNNTYFNQLTNIWDLYIYLFVTRCFGLGTTSKYDGYIIIIIITNYLHFYQSILHNIVIYSYYYKKNDPRRFPPPSIFTQTIDNDQTVFEINRRPTVPTWQDLNETEYFVSDTNNDCFCTRNNFSIRLMLTTLFSLLLLTDIYNGLWFFLCCFVYILFHKNIIILISIRGKFIIKIINGNKLYYTLKTKNQIVHGKSYMLISCSNL